MAIKIALAGNPNSGKTTLFNSLTGSSQYVGNWPGVTVEKKEGKLKGHKKDAIIVDLPGIYSLSPYSLEEVIARDYIIDEKPDAIINIVDASNLERNLYLTTQVMELGVPVVVALNMMDVVEKRGDKIDEESLSKKLGTPVIKISAVKKTGINQLIQSALEVATKKQVVEPSGVFESEIENTLSQIEDTLEKSGCPKLQKRWFAIKYFESDEKAMAKLPISSEAKKQIQTLSKQCEKDMDDDAQSIITGERYTYVGKLIDGTYKKRQERKLTVSDKIDKVVTNKWLALPIFFLVMWLVYYVSISTVGDWCIGYVETLFGWIGGGAESLLVSLGAADWTISLVVDGIIGSIGSIFTFVPQLMILFLFLALLESSGYMARVAFVMDKLLRKIGLSGRSIVPMLIGFGCTVPAVMATRTLTSERDRKMTILLTPFMSCSAKLPIYSFFVSVFFPGKGGLIMSALYLFGILMGILVAFLYRGTLFQGEPVPFVMELPNYRLPGAKNVGQLLWEKAKDFLQKAFTVIFIATIVVWFLQSFDLKLNLVENSANSMLAMLSGLLVPVFRPLGLGDWRICTSLISGFMAKESVVATLEVLFGSSIATVLTPLAAASLLVFSLLYTPCVAAIASVRRELGGKWAIAVVLWQCFVAWVAAFLVHGIGMLLG